MHVIAFLLVASETSHLANHLHCLVSREVVLKPGSYLSAKMVTVVGTEYIQDLTSGEEFQANSKVSGIVLGLKFVAGLSGICAIKAIGCDWETDWIGKIPRTGPVWYGMVRGTGNVFYFNHSVSFHLVHEVFTLTNLQRTYIALMILQAWTHLRLIRLCGTPGPSKPALITCPSHQSTTNTDIPPHLHSTSSQPSPESQPQT